MAQQTGTFRGHSLGYHSPEVATSFPFPRLLFARLRSGVSACSSCFMRCALLSFFLCFFPPPPRSGQVSFSRRPQGGKVVSRGRALLPTGCGRSATGIRHALNTSYERRAFCEGPIISSPFLLYITTCACSSFLFLLRYVGTSLHPVRREKSSSSTSGQVFI